MRICRRSEQDLGSPEGMITLVVITNGSIANDETYSLGRALLMRCSNGGLFYIVQRSRIFICGVLVIHYFRNITARWKTALWYGIGYEIFRCSKVPCVIKESYS
ncbi:hypothetical protein AVEN_114208-1 [Araneus ventricosus]|uniref:Uncharacterized protein n=1 Tax=Araneus ventricosus TaxID=182803 RepID=A0A4Y2WB93_ARAVE|nr:hypothetical protein AVEN_114208-1 [Araneus ventricosus]